MSRTLPWLALALTTTVVISLSSHAEGHDVAVGTAARFVKRNSTRCDNHIGLKTFATDTVSHCTAWCDRDEKCLALSVDLKTSECFIFGNQASCRPASSWFSSFKDTRVVNAKEGTIARLSCPKGMRISHVSARFGAPTCGTISVSDVVEDVCKQQKSCVVSVAQELFPRAPACTAQRTLQATATCQAGPEFHEDEHFTRWSSQFWEGAQGQQRQRQAGWKQFLANVPAYPQGKFHDRGIIFVAGGKYLSSALVSIKMLRDMGCTVRIQVWHLGQEELSSAQRAVLEQYKVEARDFKAVVPSELLEPIATNVGMRLFQLKPLALLYSDLEEILLVDSDNTLLMDPTYLFEEEAFRSTGTVFWPDYWKTSHDNPIWAILGLEPKSTWEQESGQLLLNKRAAWQALNLCVHFNSEFYMRLINGDKDTFRFAWLAAGMPFIMNSWLPTPVGTLKELHSEGDRGFCSHTMLQHDLQGRPLFVHHNQLKDFHLPLGENFKYQKTLSALGAHIVPVAGLAINEHQLLSCNDVVSGGLVFVDNDDAPHMKPTSLGAFEVRYFAAINTVEAELQQSKSLMLLEAAEASAANHPSLQVQQQQQPQQHGQQQQQQQQQQWSSGATFAEDILSRARRQTSDNVTVNCNVGEFELTSEVCEFITACEGDQVEMGPPTATSDRVCAPGPSFTDPILQTITVTSDGSGFNLAFNGQPAQPSPAISVSQGGRYAFQLSDVPSSSEFVIEDMQGTAVAGPATGNQVVQLEPESPGDEFEYVDATGGLQGSTITVDTTTNYVRELRGQRPDFSGPYQRYNTAYDPSNQVFTVDVFGTTSKAFLAARTECRVTCTEAPECTGFYVYTVEDRVLCHGLEYLGEPTETMLDSQSWIKTTQVS